MSNHFSTFMNCLLMSNKVPAIVTHYFKPCIVTICFYQCICKTSGMHLSACCATHLCVLSFFSRALACCSLTMTALTCGGFMWTFSFPPTRRRTVAANLVWVFNTWGGCFSMMKVLRKRGQ